MMCAFTQKTYSSNNFVVQVCYMVLAELSWLYNAKFITYKSDKSWLIVTKDLNPSCDLHVSHGSEVRFRSLKVYVDITHSDGQLATHGIYLIETLVRCQVELFQESKNKS